MQRNMWSFLVLLLVFGLVGTGCGVLQEPPTPSAPIEAVPLEIAPTPETAVEPTRMPAAEPAAANGEGEAPEPAAEATAALGEESGNTESAGLLVYRISQADSRVRFELDEDLRGNRITVVGETDQVAGELALNLADLSTAQVGVVRINARGLATDNNFRNRAIQNEILDTGAYEFITFTPTAVNGLPASAAVGEEIGFTIVGDLTIRDVTTEVTFNVVATAISPTQISGTATATIQRADYGLRIPEVPSVANVEEEVELIIEFVANS